MDGVTDHPFRFIQKKYGQPDLIYTEFTSVEGVCHNANRLLTDFLFDESQRPIIAQIYGTTPDFFRQTAIILGELGFDGIDINMGCPAKNVAHSGAGAALINTPKLAQQIIAATKQGVADWVNGASCRNCPDISQRIWTEVERRHQLLPTKYQIRRTLPVSIKTRVGYQQPVVASWIPALLEMEPAAIAIHGRTLKQQYGGAADWEQIGTAAELARDTATPILGNGDVTNRALAIHQAETYNLAGVLIGRASFGNPFVFTHQPQRNFRKILPVLLEHIRLFEQTYQHQANYSFMPMRKHLGWYVRAIPQAREVRQALFQTNSYQEVQEVLAKSCLL